MIKIEKRKAETMTYNIYTTSDGKQWFSARKANARQAEIDRDEIINKLNKDKIR